MQHNIPEGVAQAAKFSGVRDAVLEKIKEVVFEKILKDIRVLKFPVDKIAEFQKAFEKEQYFKESCQDNDGFFFNVTNDISCSTTLSYYQIKQAISVLEKWGIIQVVLKGVPAKKHFKIDHSQIESFLK